MVRHSNDRAVPPAGDSCQKPMPQLARSHFEGDPTPPGETLDILTRRDAGQPKGLALGLHKTLIGVTATPAQLVIEVGNEERPVPGGRQFMEQMQQNHGVHPARHRDHDPTSTRKHAGGIRQPCH